MKIVANKNNAKITVELTHSKYIKECGHIKLKVGIEVPIDEPDGNCSDHYDYTDNDSKYCVSEVAEEYKSLYLMLEDIVILEFSGLANRLKEGKPQRDIWSREEFFDNSIERPSPFSSTILRAVSTDILCGEEGYSKPKGFFKQWGKGGVSC